MVVDFGWGPRSCDLMSWGDVVTAYYSSGFSDIEVYSPGSSSCSASGNTQRWSAHLGLGGDAQPCAQDDRIFAGWGDR